jgi:protein disulfide-isomerase
LTINGDPIRASRTSILDTLRAITASPPKITPKSTGSSISHFFFRVKQIFTGHPWLIVGASLGTVLFGFLWRRRGGRGFGRRKEGFFVLGEKDGYLGSYGQNGGGKVD